MLWCTWFLVQCLGLAIVLLQKLKHWGCQEYLIICTPVKLPLFAPSHVHGACSYCSSNIFSSTLLNFWRWIQVTNYRSIVSITCLFYPLLLKLSLMSLGKMGSLSFLLSISSSFLSHFCWYPCWVVSHILDLLRASFQTLYFNVLQPSMYYSLIILRNVCRLSKII